MDKKCNTCNIVKKIDDFHKDKNLKDGHRNRCKQCAIIAAAKSQEKNRSKRKEYLKEYALLNKENLKLKRSEYYQKTKHQRAEYKNKNRERIRKVSAKYERDKSNDVLWKIKRNLRNRINRATKFRYRNTSAVTDLGCSVKEFIEYIEKQFKPGMTWENWGRYGWHLDHIIPLSSFDLLNESEFKKASHYSNMKPLWWHENLSKGNRLKNG